MLGFVVRFYVGAPKEVDIVHKPCYTNSILSNKDNKWQELQVKPQ